MVEETLLVEIFEAIYRDRSRTRSPWHGISVITVEHIRTVALFAVLKDRSEWKLQVGDFQVMRWNCSQMTISVGPWLIRSSTNGRYPGWQKKSEAGHLKTGGSLPSIALLPISMRDFQVGVCPYWFHWWASERKVEVRHVMRRPREFYSLLASQIKASSERQVPKRWRDLRKDAPFYGWVVRH